MRLTPLAAGTALLLCVAAGCGGDDEGDAAPAPAPAPSSATPTTPAPVLADPAAGASAVATTRQYLDAFVNGQAEQACALQTPGFTQGQLANAVTFKLVKKGATCVEFVKAVLATSKAANPSPGAAPAYLVSALEASATRAAVRVEYPQSTANPDTYVLVKRDGGWLVDSDKDVAKN